MFENCGCGLYTSAAYTRVFTVIKTLDNADIGVFHEAETAQRLFQDLSKALPQRSSDFTCVAISCAVYLHCSLHPDP